MVTLVIVIIIIIIITMAGIITMVMITMAIAVITTMVDLVEHEKIKMDKGDSRTYPITLKTSCKMKIELLNTGTELISLIINNHNEHVRFKIKK